MTELDALRRFRAARTPRRIERIATDRRDLPLSFAQERLWLLDRLMPTQAPYLVRGADLLIGPLNVRALEIALNAVIARHEALRTSFPSVGGRAVQRIHPAVARPLTCVAVSEKSLAEALAREADTPFDLATGPLFRARLYRLDEQRHVLALTMHHIISDTWSMGILVRELSHYYGNSEPLSPLPIQYADYAAWQRRWFTGATLDRQLTYWTERLRGAPPVLELPTDRPRPPIQSYRGDRHTFTVPSGLSERLAALARTQNATLFMVLTAVLVTLLHRYTGQTDIVLGTPIANRQRVETEPLIGFFANTLVLRVDAAGDPTFTELLARVRAEALAAYDHQDLPFERLVQEVQPQRSLSFNPLFQVMFVLQNIAEGSSGRLAGLDVVPMDGPVETAKFDLWLSIREVAGGLDGILEYSTDLFDAATIRRMVTHLDRIVAAASAEPERRLSGIRLLTDDEQERLAGWNDTAHPHPDTPIPELIRSRAARSPLLPAVVAPDRTLSYGSLMARADQLAHHLRSLSARPERIVAVHLRRGHHLPTALLATLTAGAAYLPLDPDHPTSRIRHILDDARPVAILTTSDLAGTLPDTRIPVVLVDRLDTRYPAEPLPALLHPDNLAYVIYTSGSTGEPKAAMLTHRGLANRLAWMQHRYGLTTRDRVLQKTPATFDVSVWELFWPLIVGAGLVVARPDGHRDGDYLVRLMRDAGVTVVHFVPPMLSAFLDQPNLDCPGLRLVMSSGEALPAELVRRFFERLPSTDLHNLYGPTEASIDVTSWQCAPVHDTAAIPIGTPVHNTTIHLLDERYESVPIGLTGHLHIGGDQLARGYLGRPALTADRFIPHPVRPGQRVYATGDLAKHRPDGAIHYLGRIDHQIKLRGYRIEPGEIDATLRTHPRVGDSFTVLDRDQPDRLVTYVVPVGGGGPDGGETTQVEQWRQVFDETFDATADGTDPLDDFAGWTCSESGVPLPAEHMREWVDKTVARIRALAPRRVLEIGCGNGLLALRLLPGCDRYTGLDVSSCAIARLRAAGGGDPRLRLVEAPAHNLAVLGDEAYDVVVLNSVVQYFPTVDYLLTVLDGAVCRLAPGGSVFLGDVRNLRLLEAFHTMVELARTPDDVPVSVLRDRVRRRVIQENELALAPELFRALGRRYAGLTSVAVRTKTGRFDNELTRFRYDVVLFFGAPSAPAGPPGTDPAALTAGPAEIALRGVLNGRTWQWAKAAALLEAPDAPATAGQLRRILATEPPSPARLEAILAWAEEHGYTADVTWAADRPDGPVDVVLRRATVGPGGPPERGAEVDWTAYANDPSTAVLHHRLAQEVRNLAAARLPEYMVPQAVVVIPRLPLTPSGKVDRRGLPAPAGERLVPEETYVAPRTAAEEALAMIWARVLGLDKVGVDDNFFELGGDSIRAIQMAARMTEAGLPLAPRDLFTAQSVAELARILDARPGPAAEIRPPRGPSADPPPFAFAGMGRADIAVLAGGRDIEDAYPLSPLQDHMLHQQVHHPRPGQYVVQGVIPMRGAPDHDALEEAWRWVIRRHPLLRTSFLWRGVPEPLQVVHATAEPEVRVLDLRGPGTDERLRRLLDEDRRRGHRLDDAPPMRIAALLRDDEYSLLISRDYARLDGWSSRIYVRDFFDAYEALLDGRVPDRGMAAPPPYARYLGWLAEQDRHAAERFWRAMLDGVAASRIAPGANGTGMRVRFATLDQPTSDDVVRAARRARVTLNTMVTAAWALTVSAETASAGVMFGTASSGRSSRLAGIEGMVGVFLNVLPLHVTVPAGWTSARWLRELSARLVAIRDHEHVSLRDVARWAGWPDGVPAFDSYLVFQNLPEMGPASRLIRPRRDTDLPAVAQMEFPLRIDVTYDGLIAVWTTSHREFFDDAESDRLMAAFLTRLGSMAAGLDRPIRELTKRE